MTDQQANTGGDNKGGDFSKILDDAEEH